ncbi:MAG: gliding motility-associated ABC transporter permease subunit GldF [Polaribacter sp.]|jgi:ABC-2 type transport system permease protein
MISILKKELNAFFSSAVGYLVIGLFLIANGLFLWVLKTDFNILNAGFADLNAFFDLTPWVFIFIIPAITMRSFVDEYTNGTMEILKTKPITNLQIVLGKFLGSGLIVLMTLLPTLIYAISIYLLSYPSGNIDMGSIVGSYLGLIFLGFVFASIGIFASSISKSQVVAFLIGVSLCFILYNGIGLVLETLGSSNSDLESLDLSSHYKNIAKGVLDSRDVIYFLSIIVLFSGLTKIIVDER